MGNKEECQSNARQVSTFTLDRIFPLETTGSCNLKKLSSPILHPRLPSYVHRAQVPLAHRRLQELVDLACNGQANTAITTKKATATLLARQHRLLVFCLSR